MHITPFCSIIEPTCFVSLIIQSCLVSFSIANVNWIGEYRASCVKVLIKTNEYAIATQFAVRLHFNVCKHDLVLVLSG